MRILLTGGAGVVGSEVVDRLARSGHDLKVLTRSSPISAIGPDATIRGDLRRPSLGLDRRNYLRLARSIDRIVHVASVVDFDAGLDLITTTNVNGTAEIVELARAGNADVVYVSTAYTAQIVAASRVTGTGCATGRDTYLASKTAGDHLVRSSGISYHILKPSIIIGDSRTGDIKRSQGLHTFIQAYRRNKLPFMPAAENCLIDFAPVDIVADAITSVVVSHEALTSRTTWLTAGNAAPTVRTLTEWVDSADGLTPGSRPMRFIPVETVQRLILPAFLPKFDPQSRHRFENMMALMALFTAEPMASDLVAERRVDHEVLRTSVEHAITWLSQQQAVTRSA